jgi:actin-related protein
MTSDRLVLSDGDDVVKAVNVVPSVRVPNTLFEHPVGTDRNSHLLNLYLLEKQTAEPIKF